MMKVCIGGTFNRLHKGHKTLIDEALKTAGSDGFVFIGIATDDLIKKKSMVKSFHDRKLQIESYIQMKKDPPSIQIEPISDRYGPTLEEDFDAIIVSKETVVGAKSINKKRQEMNKEPLQIIEIPFIRDEKGGIISSTRIQTGEIDENGKIIT